jgi:hypothetical protein
MKTITRRFALLVALFVFSCAIISCKGDKKKGSQATQKKDSLAQITEDTVVNNLEKSTFYKIPSPAELFVFLKEEDKFFNPNSLNPIENKDNYNTSTAKALNFGIYASDLAYCSMFEKNQETAKYYSVAKELADELGLVKGFDKELTQRFENNITNSDSLYHIANEAYWRAYNFLEREDKTNILPYIIVGNWIESVYIAIYSIDEFDPDDIVIKRIADQDLVLDNLMAYLNNARNKDELEDIILNLRIILRTFEKRYDNDNKKLNKELFKRIRSKINSLRNDYIS